MCAEFCGFRNAGYEPSAPASAVRHRRGLARHEQWSCAGPANRTSQQMNGVNERRSRGGFHALIESLQHCVDVTICLSDPLGGTFQVAGCDPTNLRYSRWRMLAHYELEFIEADRVQIDEVAVDPTVRNEEVKQPIHQRHVGAESELKVEIGALPHSRAFTWIYGDNAGTVVELRCEHALAEHRLRLCHVVAEQAQ
jgi:hypothetical protein